MHEIIQYLSATKKMDGKSYKKVKVSERKPNWPKEGIQRLATLAVENSKIFFLEIYKKC